MANLLIVDPDLSAAALLNDWLVPAGHVAKSVGTGKAAVQALEAELYDLVFAELRLPDVSGIELLGSVSKRWPGLPVVMLAGDSTVPEAVNAMRSGAVDFVVKPLVADEIHYVTNKAL